MRIALVGGHGGRSGVPKHIHQLCTHLAPRAKLIVVSDVNEGGYDFARTMGIEHHIVSGLASSLNPWRIRRALIDMTDTLDEAGPFDVIWAHARLALPLCRSYVRRLENPPRLIASYHGSPLRGRSSLEAFAARQFERLALLRAPRHDLLFLSEFDRVSFDGLPTDKHRSHIIPNCSDLGVVPPSNGPEHPTLVMTTRACRQKDLRATARIFQDLPDTFRLVLLGIGTDTIARWQFRQLLAPDVFARVQFVGTVEDVRPYLANADGYLLTSRYEGQSIGSLEAFEAGLPVMMPAIGGAREMRAHHPQHAIIQRDQPKRAARKIERVVRAFRADRTAHINRNRRAWNATCNPRLWGARVDALLQPLCAG